MFQNIKKNYFPLISVMKPRKQYSGWLCSIRSIISRHKNEVRQWFLCSVRYSQWTKLVKEVNIPLCALSASPSRVASVLLTKRRLVFQHWGPDYPPGLLADILWKSIKRKCSGVILWSHSRSCSQLPVSVTGDLALLLCLD